MDKFYKVKMGAIIKSIPSGSLKWYELAGWKVLEEVKNGKSKTNSKKMLPNNAIYEEYIADTGEGSSYSAPIILSFVKIDEQLQFSYSSNGKEIVGNGMLFYDLTNSSGFISKPVNESRITFNGKKYTVKDTDILRANDNTPHHYEILLK